MLITDASKCKPFESQYRVWQGIPGIAHTKGGRTFVSFYSGDTKETFGNYAVVLLSNDEKTYSEPIAVAYKAGNFRCFDPVLWIDPLDRLWFIWNVMPGEEVRASICENPDADDLVWSKDFYIGRGVMMNKPTVLSTGEWLFPIALWSFDLFDNVRKKTLTDTDVAASYVYKTLDFGKTFVCLGGADVPNRSFDEHMVYEMKNGVLRMLVRLKKGIGESYSYDRGRQWSAGHKSDLGGPSSRFHITRLRSGRLLLINHFRYTKRDHLTALLSEDDGATFPYSLLLDERSDVSYPDAMECADGSIRIVYDRERGCFKSSLEEAYASAREILTASITEEDILNGAICSPKSYLARVICKLSRLPEGTPDPYHPPITDPAAFAEELLGNATPDPIESVFDRFPLNCAMDHSEDFKKLDTLITRFKMSDSRDKRILQQIIEIVSRTSKVHKPSPISARVCDYIEQHLAEDISVSKIAEHFHISLYYLSHIFKAATGTTITEYRNELRLTKAKLLLKNTNLRIGQIACEVGFDSVSYFTETFSRSEKITPQKYRKLHKKD